MSVCDLVSATERIFMKCDVGDLYKTLLSKHGFRENRPRKVILPTFLNRFGWNSIYGISTKYRWVFVSFVKINAVITVLSLTWQMELCLVFYIFLSDLDKISLYHMPRKISSVIITFVKIGPMKAIIYVGRKWIYAGTFHILCPIWMKISKRDTNMLIILPSIWWVSWKQVHGRPYFSYGCTRSREIVRYAVSKERLGKVCVLCYGVHHSKSCWMLFRQEISLSVLCFSSSAFKAQTKRTDILALSWVRNSDSNA